MSKKAARALQWALLAIVAVVAAERVVSQHEGPAVKSAGAAPSLALSDLGGRKVDLATYRGKAVAVNFWATWCPPCRAELPDLVEVRKEHAGDCFELLGVAVNSGGADQVAAFAKEHGMTYPVLVDDGLVSDAWKVESLPTTFIIDPKGNISFSTTGAVTRAQLEKQLKIVMPLRAGC